MPYAFFLDISLKTSQEFEVLQNAEAIITRATGLLDSIISEYGNIKAIGITGQMHGIVYTDKNGNAVSPLYNWQDKRGDLLYLNNQTYCEYISAHTQSEVATGYGIVTHFYNLINGITLPSAYKICTIMDYFTMRFRN